MSQRSKLRMIIPKEDCEKKPGDEKKKKDQKKTYLWK
jgi:hypothetical protein